MRRCIAAHLSAQSVLQQSLEAPEGADSRALWSGNLPTTAALLRGLILLADTKFDGEMLVPDELLRSLPQRCGAFSVRKPLPHTAAVITFQTFSGVGKSCSTCHGYQRRALT